MTDWLLFGQESASESLVRQIFDVEVLALMLPGLFILVGGAVAIVYRWLRHRERLAMIRQGMHPDQPAKSQQPVVHKPPQRHVG